MAVIQKDRVFQLNTVPLGNKDFLALSTKINKGLNSSYIVASRQSGSTHSFSAIQPLKEPPFIAQAASITVRLEGSEIVVSASGKDILEKGTPARKILGETLKDHSKLLKDQAGK